MTTNHQQAESVQSNTQQFTQPHEGRPSTESKIGAGNFGHPRRVEWILHGNEIAKFSEKLHALAHERTSKTVHKIEADAKRFWERLGERAEGELREFLAHARQPTKEKWIRFGAEMVRLGEKIQAIAAPPIAGADIKSADHAASETKN